MNLKIMAIIPARGGSKGLPHKNIRILNGKPLIYHTIKAAKSSRRLDRITVSTEDSEIAKCVQDYGAEVINRPVSLARDDTPSLAVCQHAISYLYEAENYLADIIVILQPTSPLRITTDIDDAISKLLQTGCETVVSVCKTEHPISWIYTLKGDALEPVIKEEVKVTRRQDAPDTYRLNGAVCITRRDIIMKQNRVMGDDTRALIMPVERSIDIDTLLDFKLAEMLMREAECQLPEPLKKSG